MAKLQNIKKAYLQIKIWNRFCCWEIVISSYVTEELTILTPFESNELGLVSVHHMPLFPGCEVYMPFHECVAFVLWECSIIWTDQVEILTYFDFGST